MFVPSGDSHQCFNSYCYLVSVECELLDEKFLSYPFKNYFMLPLCPYYIGSSTVLGMQLDPFAKISY